MNSKIKTLIAATSLVLAIGGAASGASAATTWHNDHRVVVASRYEHRNLRIREEMRLRELNLARIHRMHIAAHRDRFEHHFDRHVG